MSHARVRELLARHWGITPARVRRLTTSDSTAHRIDTERGSFVLRTHGTHSDAEVASSMLWLDALRESDVRAPTPIRTRGGAWVAEHSTLVTWLGGRQQRRRPRSVHFTRLGRTMAQLHTQVLRWTPPGGFTRPPWGAADVFCERGVAVPPSGDPWALVPASSAPVLREAAAHSRPALDSPDRHLIHADMHLQNVVFADGLACPFDFDDSGYGPWGYDVASALGNHRLQPEWPTILAAFLDGYAAVRPVPELADLDAFLVGRITGLALWCASMAQSTPSYREPLPKWIAHFEGQLRGILG